MKEKITVGVIVGVIVGVAVAAIVGFGGYASGLIPDTSDYRIPSGAVMAFALEQPPHGWEVYKNAKGRFILGADSEGSLAEIGSLGGNVLSDHFEAVNGDIGVGGSNFLRPPSDNGFPADLNPPFVKLLICRKK